MPYLHLLESFLQTQNTTKRISVDTFFSLYFQSKMVRKGAEKNLSDPSKIIGFVAQKPIKFFMFQNSQLHGNVMILQKRSYLTNVYVNKIYIDRFFSNLHMFYEYTLKINRGDCQYCSYNRKKMASFSNLVRFFLTTWYKCC